MNEHDHIRMALAFCLISVTLFTPYREYSAGVLSGREFTTYVLASSAVGAFVHASRMASDFLKHFHEHYCTCINTVYTSKSTHLSTTHIGQDSVNLIH